MTTRFLINSNAAYVLVLLSCLPVILSSGNVTLESIEIFTTHEWLKTKPTVYFHCKGEKEMNLPDVKKAHFLYKFKGEESWQPLTDLADKKCKRCGLYERDIKPDDVFDEWELCPSDFIAPEGKYIHFKHKEFNATFLCPNCTPLQTGPNRSSATHSGDDRGKRTKLVLVILIAAVVSTICIIGAVAACKYWQRKKREHDQARFLKLFEEGDDIEDELGLGHVI